MKLKFKKLICRIFGHRINTADRMGTVSGRSIFCSRCGKSKSGCGWPLNGFDNYYKFGNELDESN